MLLKYKQCLKYIWYSLITCFTILIILFGIGLFSTAEYFIWSSLHLKELCDDIYTYNSYISRIDRCDDFISVFFNIYRKDQVVTTNYNMLFKTDKYPIKFDVSDYNHTQINLYRQCDDFHDKNYYLKPQYQSLSANIFLRILATIIVGIYVTGLICMLFITRVGIYICLCEPNKKKVKYYSTQQKPKHLCSIKELKDIEM